ncbi:hypothetical protein HELRODRAFT_63719 [Helobdella robusta]|uniref:Thioredoxin domain-containing protein n=1 Tax=Helobdella robusta TaxID=6412 RepID=T1FXJ1_HELRO|nr:hypothetical protein HELRODRAFT_63719 [Helobdella robusta]ESO12494.1 hypothetical protein HELRODRAFT_63719 [Helobdella robusta]
MTGRGKGKEVQLQVEIENQEDWEEQIAKEGLLVVDVYQDWCGPCKAMVPIFKRIKNETQDDLLRFATAKADSVEALERYRGRCEPAFLFYAGGVLVEATHGADAPTINRSIVEQLAIEHTVLDAGGTRVEVVLMAVMMSYMSCESA